MATSLRLLLLEDRPGDAELTLHELRRSGFDPDWQLVDTEEAYRAELSDDLDIILADYTLPQFDAPRALAVLNESRLDIPFIVVTGSIGEEQAVECIKQGATDYLLKDRLTRLGSAVEHALEQKRIREAQRQAEATQNRLNTIIEATTDFISVMDIQGQLFYLNRAGRAMLGFEDTEDVIGFPVTDALPLTSRRAIIQDIFPMVQREGIWSGEMALLTQAGQEIPVSLVIIAHRAPDGTTEFLSAIARDIRERKQAEEALRRHAFELERRVMERTAELQQEKERVEAILDNSSDAIILANFDGNIQQVNPAFTEHFGYSTSYIVGHNLLTLSQADSTGMLLEVLQGIVTTHDRARVEIAGVRNDGTVFEADVAMAPIIEHRRLSGIVCSVRDVTERKRVEQELRRALERERELNELKSRFVSMVSHEFRTPLAVILGSADMLLRYEARMEAVQRSEHLTQIQAKIFQLNALVDTVLGIGRAETIGIEFAPERVDFEHFCRELLQEVQLTTASHTFNFVTNHACDAVWVDPKLMRQALTNLLSNAIKYSPDGGLIDIVLHCSEAQMTLSVEDRGIGIPEEDQKYLFEVFHRAHNVGDIAGTGLGLSLIKQAVDAHQGVITFDSTVGVGTTFTIVLPLTPTGDTS